MPRPFVPAALFTVYDLEWAPTPEKLVAGMDGDRPWAIVDGQIDRVGRPSRKSSRMEVQVEVSDLIHESEPVTGSGSRVAVDFAPGAKLASGGSMCTLDDWRYALPPGTRLVADQSPGKDVLRANVTGLFFEAEDGIKGGNVPLPGVGAWRRIGSLDELAERFRTAGATGG